MRLVSVVTSTRSPRRSRWRISSSRSSTWPAHRADLDLGIDQAGRADDLLDDDALRQLQLELAPAWPRRRSLAASSATNSSNIERPVVERARQPEAVVDERLLARAVAVVHAADLRQRDVRLVDDDEEVLGEVVEQARRVARPAARPDRWRE